jgi:LmbE family N-acetylglucosaminyl deacetylase
MAGWAANDEPGAFWRADVDAVASVLASLVDEERAETVITYDERGYYGHPDHVMAHRVTARRAVEISRCAQRLWFPVTATAVLETFRTQAAAAAGVPAGVGD